jgi:hypothetical protein
VSNSDSQLGAAILGLFGAIKICRREGYDVRAVLDVVEKQTEEWGLLPDRQHVKRTSPAREKSGGNFLQGTGQRSTISVIYQHHATDITQT